VCVAEPTGPPTPALPAKTIGYELIAIHDPDSGSYNGDCIGCHTDRTNEVALDDVTSAAHARMLGLFGEGNDRCIRCHGSGPNFLTASAGGLREQVDMANVACAACHGAQPISGATALYAE
jgi:mono/diheme cytochrome c family protein